MSRAASRRKGPADLELANRALSTATIMFHQAIADRLGLNPTDHKCLDILLRVGPHTAGQLARHTGLTSGAITGVVDRLERAGFVRRVRVPGDRRQVRIQPVDDPAVLGSLARLFEPLGRAVGRLNSSYSDKELAVILDYMTRAEEILRRETAALRQG